jgi:hypothetical protein
MKEEVNATVGPVHSTVTVAKPSLATDRRLQVVEQRVELVEVLASGHISTPEAYGLVVSLT